jgi:hypothetical protein
MAWRFGFHRDLFESYRSTKLMHCDMILQKNGEFKDEGHPDRAGIICVQRGRG